MAESQEINKISNANQNIYKEPGTDNTNILPGDRNRSPDESFNSTLVFIDAGFLYRLIGYISNQKSVSNKIIRKVMPNPTTPPHMLPNSLLSQQSVDIFGNTVINIMYNWRVHKI